MNTHFAVPSGHIVKDVSEEEFAIPFFQNKGSFLFIGRLTVALFGTATVLVTYLIGRDCFNRRTGIFAALFLLLITGHVMSSQVKKTDVPTVFFTMLSFFFILVLKLLLYIQLTACWT